MSNSSTDEKLQLIESRLTQIEKALNISSIAKNTNTETSFYTPKETQPQGNQPITSAYTLAAETYTEPKPGNWLGIIAIICFILAAGFIIKLSIDSGWLTPARQIAIAIFFGLSLIFTGLQLSNTDREYASLLPGAGIIILYLSVFAAHRYYNLIPFEAAILLTGIVSIICILLYRKINHDIYPITAAIGSYIAPAILGLNTSAVFSLYYFLLCSFAFALISIAIRSRILTMISAYLAILATAFVGLEINQDLLIASILFSQFIIFSTCVYSYTTKHYEPLTQDESWSFLPVLLIFYATEYYFISHISQIFAPWISLGFAAILIGFYLSAKQYFSDNLGSRSLIFAFVSIVCFHSIYLEILPAVIKPWLFVGILLGAAFLRIDIGSDNRGNPFYIPIFVLLAILGIEYISMLSHLIDGSNASWLIVSLVAFGSMWVVLAGNNLITEKEDTYGNTLLGAAHIIGILSLYRLTCDIGSLAVSASWLFYAVGVLLFASSRKDEVMARSSLFVLAFAAAKALLYDVASEPTIIRILCLLLTGIVLYGAGFLMRQIASWKN